MNKLNIFCLSCLILMSSSIFSQPDIRGLYIRTDLSLPDPSLAVWSTSLTLFNEASMNVNRPTVKIFLGPGFGNVNLPLINTVSVNSSVNETIYTRTIDAGSYVNPIFIDSFWVAGIKNFSFTDKSRILVSTYAGMATWEIDSSPEVNNLPLSPSNFTISGNQVLYNPFCTDADGDSLSYDFGMLATPAGYHIPSNATLDPVTGLFTFSKDSTDLGLYAFLIYITDWRMVNGGMGPVGITVLAFVLTTNPALGIKDFSNSSTLGLYPNPTNNIINFKTSESNSFAKTELEVSNTLGEIVLRRSDFDTSQNIDVSSLPPGIYMIQIKQDGRIYKSKFTKSSL